MESAAAPYYVSALLAPGAAHWGPGGTVLGGGQTGQAATVTFGFPGSAAGLTGADASGFAPMGEAQKAAARQALGAWAAVAGLAFVETADPAAEIRFGTNRQDGASAAYAYYPGAVPGGGVFLANDVAGNAAPAQGTYAFLTLVHESGHALGLKHPGNYDARIRQGQSPFLPAGEDNRVYSVMSYNQGAVPPGSWPTGLSIYDIAAVQHLYGANMAVAPGDTGYAVESGRYRAVWDPNGVNALDARTQAAPVTLDLRPGGVSTVGGQAAVGLAFGTQVQRAYGGGGDDTLIPNALGDALDGGGGGNAAVFAQASTAYALTRMTAPALVGTYVVAGPDGNSVLTNIQTVRFADGAVVPLDPSTAAPFDALRYMSSNPDVARAYGGDGETAARHYVTHGVFERRPLDGFDPARYLAGYPDLGVAFGTDARAAEQHYVTYGVHEGRSSAGLQALQADDAAQFSQGLPAMPGASSTEAWWDGCTGFGAMTMGTLRDMPPFQENESGVGRLFPNPAAILHGWQ